MFIAGFVDSKWEGIADFEKTGYRVVTDMEGFAAYIRKNVVDEVVLSLPLKSKYEMASSFGKDIFDQFCQVIRRKKQSATVAGLLFMIVRFRFDVPALP